MAERQPLCTSRRHLALGQQNDFPLAQCDILRADSYRGAKAASISAGGRAEPYTLGRFCDRVFPAPCSPSRGTGKASFCSGLAFPLSNLSSSVAMEDGETRPSPSLLTF